MTTPGRDEKKDWGWIERIRWAAADGVVCVGCAYLLGELFFSRTVMNGTTVVSPPAVIGTAGIVFVVLCAFFLGTVLNRISVRKEMLLHILLSTLAYIPFLLLILVNYLTLRIHIFAVGEFGDAHGVLYIFVMGIYMLYSGFMRLAVFAVFFFKCKSKP